MTDPCCVLSCSKPATVRIDHDGCPHPDCMETFGCGSHIGELLGCSAGLDGPVWILTELDD